MLDQITSGNTWAVIRAKINALMGKADDLDAAVSAAETAAATAAADATAAVQTTLEGLVTAAETSAGEAQESADVALATVARRFGAVTGAGSLLASMVAAGGAGTIWEADVFRYREAAAGASDHHVTTAGGVKLYVLPVGGRMHWRAFGPTFDLTTNNSALFQTAARAASSAGVPLIVDGNFAMRSAVTVPNRVTILAHDATIHDPDNLALIVDLQGAGSRWEGGTFVGYETYVQFQAAVPSSMSQAQSCIRLSGAGSQAIAVTATNKKNAVRITASGCRAERCDLTGYFPNVVLSGAPITGANYLPCVYFEGVQSGWAIENSAKNAGSAVLWGMESSGINARGNRGSHLWDNGVYGSSGNDNTAEENSFSDVYGTGVKMRGSRNSALRNRSTRCGTGWSLTGNGATPDSRGANGHGNVAIGNIDVDSYSYPWSAAVQDGLYQRDLTMIGNVSINGSTRGGGFSAQVIALGSITANGNMLVDHKGTTAAMIITGPPGQELIGGTISGNTMMGGASEGMRLTSMRGVAVTGNSGRGNAQALCEWRNVNECSFVGNVCEDGNVFEWSSSFPGTGCLVGGNVGATSVTASLRASNLFTPGHGGTHLAPNIASAPVAVGQEAWVSNILYRSVGTASTADWIRVN